MLQLKEYGCPNMVSKLRAVLVRSPEFAWGKDNFEQWGYLRTPNISVAKEEHIQLVQILEDEGINVFQHDQPINNKWDSIYTYDPTFIMERGVILLNMGKKLRRGEEVPLGQKLEDLGIPTYYTLKNDAYLEGGDTLRLTDRILAVGITYRTNQEGINQLTTTLERFVDEVIEVQLPHYLGPSLVLHLMSVISMVDYHKAVVYPKLTPISFLRTLKQLNIEWVETTPEEFLTHGCNVLALAPGKCLVVDGNPITRKRLETIGCDVLTYQGDEITQNGGGGPTCLTLPLLRRD